MSDRAGAMKTFGEYSSEMEAVNPQKIEVHRNNISQASILIINIVTFLTDYLHDAVHCRASGSPCKRLSVSLLHCLRPPPILSQ